MPTSTASTASGNDVLVSFRGV
ncbi:MAG: hypothetical protein JWP29_4440, partial [Rhodoferax sp.]|nr:hypothetical protein [Rhodoferax sp.]